MRPVFHNIEQVNTITAFVILTPIKNSRSIQTISPLNLGIEDCNVPLLRAKPTHPFDNE